MRPPVQCILPASLLGFARGAPAWIGLPWALPLQMSQPAPRPPPNPLVPLARLGLMDGLSHSLRVLRACPSRALTPPAAKGGAHSVAAAVRPQLFSPHPLGTCSSSHAVYSGVRPHHGPKIGTARLQLTAKRWPEAGGRITSRWPGAGCCISASLQPGCPCGPRGCSAPSRRPAGRRSPP